MQIENALVAGSSRFALTVAQPQTTNPLTR